MKGFEAKRTKTQSDHGTGRQKPCLFIVENVMKKLVCLLVVLALSAPLFATEITVTASDAGSQQLQIGYTVVDGDPPTGVSLLVTVVGADVDSVVSVDSFFDVYIDYIHDNMDVNDPNSVIPLIGAGTPLAQVGVAGQQGLPVTNGTQFAISLGALDDANQVLATEANLVTLQLSTGAVVSFAADTTRGSVVGPYDTVNLPSPVTVGPDGDDCWDYDCFSCGDSNGDCFITFAGDVQPVIDAWPATGGTYNKCADYDKSGFITFAGDVQPLINHWPANPQPGYQAGCLDCGTCTPE